MGHAFSHSPAQFRRPGPDRRWTLLVPAFIVLLLVAVIYMLWGRTVERVGSVVVYTSQDQAYAEPLLKKFERQAGIQVRALYDSEAVKTVGLVNRLVAERGRPQCDLFWNNEELRTRQLESRGIVKPGWVSLGYRSRRVVINTNLVAPNEPPRSLLDLTNAAWKARVVLAYPLFGTTATHFLALRQHWGEEVWRSWCEAMMTNGSLVVDGNSVVVRLVAQGQAAVGLTDSDDIAAGIREGYPVRALAMTDETLLIPNTVALVKGAPHPENADKLLRFLQDPTTLAQLVGAQALESAADPSPIPGLKPDWAQLLEQVDDGTEFLKQTFLK